MKVRTLILAAAMIAAVSGLVSFTSAPQVESSKEKGAFMEHVVAWYMDHINYGTITMLMAVESSFIPFPSEVVVPPAAYKASQPGSDLNIFLVILFATIGAMIGAVINYVIALWLGRPVIYAFTESRIGRLCLLSREKVEKAEAYFVRHGKASTFIGRLVPAVRQLISVPAGLARMPFHTFLLYTFLGAAIWNIILAILGKVAQGNADLINTYSRELSYLLLALGVIFVGYLFYNAFARKKKKRETSHI